MAPNLEFYYDDVASLGRPIFEIRLAQFLNTVFLYTVHSDVTLGISRILDWPGINTVSIDAENAVLEKIFSCNKTWFAILLFICVVVIVPASVSGIVLRAMTLAPDVLGTLSIVTLDNRCGKQLQKAYILDGLERSRLLKQVSIKLGNVERNGSSGRIAFAAPVCEEVMELEEREL
ncbi:hypothetical protein F53441_5753 [Fusarium austroafricanum]|uniref:Uncharacterized protein n=1 Tax=Fusarium austroafricanum TaxID=2364996 RepID=A0A8H4KJ98_9HYPO|nr:hypothetical protein F53441_5753 [Fusarium austroafricanum]